MSSVISFIEYKENKQQGVACWKLGGFIIYKKGGLYDIYHHTYYALSFNCLYEAIDYCQFWHNELNI